MRTTLPAVCLAVLGSVPALCRDLETTALPLEDVLARAAETLGPPLRSVVRLDGSAEFFGAPASVRLWLAPDGRFCRELDGCLAEKVVFDGERVWQVDDAGVPYELHLSSRDQVLLQAALFDGSWAAAEAPFERELLDAAQEPDTIVLSIRARGSEAAATLLLDARTCLPRRLELPMFSGSYRLDLEDYRRVGGRAVPHRAVALSAKEVPQHWSLEGSTADPAAEPLLARPASVPRGARFLPDLSPQLEVRRAPTGHPFVRARLDGQDLGWLAFDTGAAVSVITESAASACAMSRVGETRVGGAGATVEGAALRRGKELALGPVVLEDPTWIEAQPEGSLADVFRSLEGLVGGERVAGIVGWDLLIRCVVELDFERGRIGLFDPASYALAEAEWQPLVLHHRHPFVRARYEGDRDELFLIDSGAGASTVFFHSPTVIGRSLLEGRATVEFGALGAGGELRMRQGSLEWFEVAGRRIEDPLVLFSLDEKGAFADRDSSGTLGHAFFEPFVLVLDYGRSRIAFRPRG